MIKRTTILYLLLWAAYVVFTLTMFPQWKGCVILLFPLLALGGWLFGRTIGLFLLIPSTIYHYLLFSEIYGNFVVYYEDRFIGTVISIIVVILTGTLRENLDAIKATNQKLDRLVAERNEELNALSSKLIAVSEKTRISLGQELHDGIGQHLTGIKLFSTSLSDQLHRERNPAAPLADSITNGISKIHGQIRQIARMFFPVQIGQVGLIPALNELAACFRDMHHIEFSINECENLPEIPERTALELYRICQETANYAIDHLKVSRIVVRLSGSDKIYSLEFEHTGLPLRLAEQSNALRLLEYRLLQISGTLKQTHCNNDSQKTVFTIPNPERGTRA